MLDYLPMLATLIAVITAVFYVWAKYKLNYWQRLGVPTLPTNIFFGNVKDTIFLRISASFLLGRLYNEAKNNEPYLGVYVIHKPFFLLRDPKLIKQMFVKDSNIFQDRFFTSRNKHDRLGYENLFSIDNPKWRYLRKKLSPIFSSGKLKLLFSLIVKTSESLETFLYEEFKEDPNIVKSIEVADISTMYTTDVMSSIAFGVSTNSFEKPTPDFYVRSRIAGIMTIKKTIQMFFAFFFPSLTCLFDNSFFGEYTDYFRGLFWDSMNTRERSKSERGDAIDLLLKLKNEKQQIDFKLEGDTLVAQSVILFVAGLETTAMTMAFALWELARQPQIQKQVRSEIRECLKDNGLTYESINNMKYLMQVIDETLRFYPPAPLIDRVASQDYKIPDSDIVLKQGTVVYAPLPGIHMDPKYFPNPEKFDPDRFSDVRKKKILPCTYMPFGEGPRVCIGTRVGMLQTAIGLVRFLRDYEVSVNPKYQVKVDTRNIFTKPADGVHLFIKKAAV